MIRYAIFAAVSTKPQAADGKTSLEDQITLSRQDALTRRWKETAGPFIVKGEPRTRWVNLRDAEDQIVNPDGTRPLKEMLDAASRREFDVLIVYHYNRMRDLLEPVARTLQAYGIQMTSHSQWTEPQNPASYDPLLDTGFHIRFATGFASQSEIMEIRRRVKQGTAGRIRQGYPQSSPPYGYRTPPRQKPKDKVIPVIDPVTSAVVIRIKDLFFQGHSIWQICLALTKDKIKTPSGKTNWSDTMVRDILINRFYCGKIQHGITRRVLDPRTGKITIVRNPPSRITTVKGLHTPLWDMPTQHRIEAELKRRGKNYSGIRTQRLSNLLYCGVCGARVHVAYTGGGAYTGAHDHNRQWLCSQDRNHVNRTDTELLYSFIKELQRFLSHAQAAPISQPDSSPERSEAKTKDTIQEINRRLQRNQEAYEAGAMTLAEYATRKEELQAIIQKEQNKAEDLRTAQARAIQRQQTIKDFQAIIQKIPRYITKAPAQEVNTHLRSIIQKIIITPTSVTIELID